MTPGSIRTPRAFDFLLIAFAFMVNMMGTTLPTAIYHDYQIAFGFTPPVITMIYASYAVGVLGALLLIGNGSDQWGRKRMLLGGLCVSAASAIAFLVSHGLAMLLLGRLLSGISAGIFTGTATVSVIELSSPARRGFATLAATASNMLGLGLGPVVGGALVEFLPALMRLPYVAHLALVLVAAWAVCAVPETVRAPARAKLRLQRISLPAEVRKAFVPAALSGFAGFVVVGFFAAVAPQLMRALLGYRSTLLIGLVIGLLFACSACAQAAQGLIAPSRRQVLGCAVLLAGLACIGLCVPTHSSLAFLVGTVLCGLGQGVSFRAALGEIAARSPDLRRAEVTSAYFVVLYVALSLPVIGLGVAIQGAGIARATLIFAALTMGIVLLALLLLWRGVKAESGAAGTAGG